MTIRILAKVGQAFVTAEDVRMFRIDAVIVGWEDGTLAGSYRVVDRIVSTATAQASKDAVFAAIAIARMSAVNRPLTSAQARQQQAGENEADPRFGDAVHHVTHPRCYGGKGR